MIYIFVNKKPGEKSRAGYSLINRSEGKIAYNDCLPDRISIFRTNKFSYIQLVRLIIKLLFGLIADVLQSFCRLLRFDPDLFFWKVVRKVCSSRMATEETKKFKKFSPTII